MSRMLADPPTARNPRRSDVRSGGYGEGARIRSDSRPAGRGGISVRREVAAGRGDGGGSSSAGSGASPSVAGRGVVDGAGRRVRRRFFATAHTPPSGEVAGTEAGASPSGRAGVRRRRRSAVATP